MINEHERAVKEHLKRVYPDSTVTCEAPLWLKNNRWRPDFLVKRKTGDLLAVQLLLSGGIPKYQYLNIVPALQRELPKLSVVIVTLEGSYEEDPDIANFCRRHRLGLKIIIPGLGVQTILRTPFDPPVVESIPVEEEGWFPGAILNRCRDLDKLVYSSSINRFIEQVEAGGCEQSKTRELVLETIDELLGKHPSFRENLGQFMKLVHFEDIVKFASLSASEHVFHSFRVFLAGCPVINKFYDFFTDAHKRFCIGAPTGMCVEYAWLLTAIFHDIGRPKEGAAPLLRAELEDEDLEISVVGKSTRWARDWNISARRILGSLGAFVAAGGSGDSWDGGALIDDEGERMSLDWIGVYDEMRSHAVISAFDFLGAIFKKASAADERRHRPFVLSHAVPAALSIFLHDFRIWPEAKNWNLFPVDCSMLPMAALLIYLDTWDDFKRKGNESTINVRDYRITKRGARVVVEWGDAEKLDGELLKYRSYKRALKNKPFSLTIKAGMASDV